MHFFFALFPIIFIEMILSSTIVPGKKYFPYKKHCFIVIIFEHLHHGFFFFYKITFTFRGDWERTFPIIKIIILLNYPANFVRTFIRNLTISSKIRCQPKTEDSNSYHIPPAPFRCNSNT
jgi:hypothetical protein